MSIHRNRKNNILTIDQETYLHKVLDTFDMSIPKSNTLSLIFSHNLDNREINDGEILTNITYVEVVGSNMYSMVCTKPDLAYSISISS